MTTRFNPDAKFTAQKLEAADRPKFLYRFTVAGRGHFPVDMLRYDACWPATTEDSVKICGRHSGIVTVKLTSYREPTEARWNSFAWVVERRY